MRAGAPGSLVGGLTKDGHPHTGPARAFGIVGLVAAVLNVIAILIPTLAPSPTDFRPPKTTDGTVGNTVSETDPRLLEETHDATQARPMSRLITKWS